MNSTTSGLPFYQPTAIESEEILKPALLIQL